MVETDKVEPIVETGQPRSKVAEGREGWPGLKVGIDQSELNVETAKLVAKVESG